MSTVVEIVEAVKKLSPAERRDLVQQLEPVLLESLPAEPSSADYTTRDFASRLTQHFHRAKRAALARTEAA